MEISRPNALAYDLHLIVEITEIAMIARVLTFIPPATDAAEPPINIKAVKKKFVCCLVSPKCTVEKPDVLPLMDSKSDMYICCINGKSLMVLGLLISEIKKNKVPIKIKMIVVIMTNLVLRCNLENDILVPISSIVQYPMEPTNIKVPIIASGIVVIITAVTRAEFKKSKRIKEASIPPKIIFCWTKSIDELI